MENANANCYSETAGTFYRKFFLPQNIFDDEFLKEKDKALSPIIISDIIKEESKNQNNIKCKTMKQDEEKDIKYGSNIIYIGSEIDDSENDGEKFFLKEQIKMVTGQQKSRKKSNKKAKNIIHNNKQQIKK